MATKQVGGIQESVTIIIPKVNFDPLPISDASLSLGWRVFEDLPPRSGPCDLITSKYDSLEKENPATFALLNATFGKTAKIEYDGNMTNYNHAVLLNTVAAVSAQGVDLSKAKFVEFYRGDKANTNAFGITLSGITPKNLDDANLLEIEILDFPAGRRSPDYIKEGSVEATITGKDIEFDVDLYNPNGNLLKHWGEAKFNKDNNTTTHPADVVRKLNARGVQTGVKCK